MRLNTWDDLINLLPPSFHIPEMNIQLWNIKMTLAMSGLEANNDVNGLGNYANSTTKTPTLSTTHYEEVCKEVLGTKAY